MEKLPIFHVVFAARRTMNLAVGRVSEYVENPVLARTVFTWNDLDRWWESVRGAKRTAFIDYWDGFNLPVAEFAAFRAAGFPDLNAEERAMLAIVDGLPADGYVIATAKGGAASVLPHEVIHGLYRLLPDYRREVDATIGRALREGSVPNVMAALARMGYGEQTFVDEINAYLATRVEPRERMCGPGERALRAVLRDILRRHLGGDLRGKAGHRRAAALVHRIVFTRRP